MRETESIPSTSLATQSNARWARGTDDTPCASRRWRELKITPVFPFIHAQGKQSINKRYKMKQNGTRRLQSQLCKPGPNHGLDGLYDRCGGSWDARRVSILRFSTTNSDSFVARQIGLTKRSGRGLFNLRPGSPLRGLLSMENEKTDFRSAAVGNATRLLSQLHELRDNWQQNARSQVGEGVAAAGSDRLKNVIDDLSNLRKILQSDDSDATD